MPSTDYSLEKDLKEVIEGEVRFDRVSRSLYATDASVYQIVPQGVVIPRTPQDVITTLLMCRMHGVPITARGGGTSQAGQAIGEGIQLDFSKYMNAIIEFRPDDALVRVQPGIVLDELNAFLRPYNLQLPLDISTSNRATVGGMIANNSAGTRSVVYGKTIDYVEQVQVVLSDGSVIDLKEMEQDTLQEKCNQEDLEGRCYDMVRRLAATHSREIDKRYPKLLRRVGGYNLDEFVSPSSFNLSKMIVGSEGTLALVTEATLRLVPIPPCRVLMVVQFRDLLESLAATPLILTHQPSAIELIDRFILDTTRGKPEFLALRSFLSEDPAAVLIVEFSGDNESDLRRRVDALEKDLKSHQQGYEIYQAWEPKAQADIWNLRRAALGLSMSQTGDAKAISFVEDTAVVPDKLRDYIERLIRILAANNTQAGFYAHASVGLLHVRPVVNMKVSQGIEQFQCVANEVADLVLEFGGALSGEHGDGLVRSPFQRRMFGEVLYEAFCELKDAFDPEHVLNPGKIVRAPELTEHLRFGADYQTPSFDTGFDFSDFGGLLPATEQCGGVGSCRKTQSGSMCPSYMATREEADSTRGRANAFRQFLAGDFETEQKGYRQLFPVFDLCLECKACKTECPTGVDMARIKSEFLHQYHRHCGSTWQQKLMSRADQLASFGTRLTPVSNWLLESPFFRHMNQWLLGIDARRTLPRFASRSFMSWWSNRDVPDSRLLAGRRAVLFVDTFTNYYEPEHAMSAVTLAERVGITLDVVGYHCCGRPAISKGFLDRARDSAKRVQDELMPWVQQGVPILFLEPSCYSSVSDDHLHLLPESMRTQAKQVASSCHLFDQWLMELATRDSSVSKCLSEDIRRGPGEVLVHGHCHQRSLTGMDSTRALLSLIPDCKVTVLDSGCCGMAGSFGYEQSHYELSKTIGEQRLFPAVREKGEHTSIIATGFSCRHQIDHFTGITSQSVPVLLDQLMSMGRLPDES